MRLCVEGGEYQLLPSAAVKANSLCGRPPNGIQHQIAANWISDNECADEATDARVPLQAGTRTRT